MDSRLTTMVNEATMNSSHPLVTLHPPVDPIARFQGNIGNKAAATGYKIHSIQPPQEHPTPIYKQESGGCSWPEENWRMSGLVYLGRGKGRFDCEKYKQRWAGRKMR